MSVTEYELDWRKEKLAKATGGQVTNYIIGIAKAGYVFAGGTNTSLMPWSGDQGSSVGFSLPVPAVAKRLQVQVLSNTLSGAAQLVLRKNETDTTMLVSIPAGGTGLYVTTGSVFYALTDRLDFRLQTAGLAIESIDIPGIAVVLEILA